METQTQVQEQEPAKEEFEAAVVEMNLSKLIIHFRLQGQNVNGNQLLTAIQVFEFNEDDQGLAILLGALSKAKVKMPNIVVEHLGRKVSSSS